VVIRPAHEDDLERAAALVTLLDPIAIVSAGSLRHRVPDAFVAEVDGEIVGWAPSGTGWFFVGVHPEHRRRGLGAQLFDRIAERRRGERAAALGLDADGERFLERRGFERHGVLRTAVLDLREAVLPELPETPYRVAPLAEVRDRVRELYDLTMETLLDVPHAEGFHELGLDEWRGSHLDNPLLDGEISTVVLDGERTVAFAWLLSNREDRAEPGPRSPSPRQGGRRAAADYAGTARSHRGRGLATLAKLASTRAAQAAGLESIVTENDTDNEPMLHINAKLGFKPGLELGQYVKKLER
jgi:GNAT superfamily N-acetyltransferase